MYCEHSFPSELTFPHFFSVIMKLMKTSNPQSWYYDVYPLWDYVNLGLYNCVAYILMVTLNGGLIHHLTRLSGTRVIQHSQIQHRSMLIALLITTLLFLSMIVPSTITFAFFSPLNIDLLQFFDSLIFQYHILSFPLYMFTFNEFRRQCLAIILWERQTRKTAPPPSLNMVAF